MRLLALVFLPLLSPAAELLVCGWDEVFIIDTKTPTKKLWSWKAATAPELPASYKDQFKTTDDCKLVSNNRILITASSSGIALVERASRKTTFWGLCTNVHSADLLPNDRIAVACSTGATGNRLAIFDAKTPEKQLFTTELYSGHGALWDSKRNTLWALGGRELRAYSLVAWDSATPSLKLEATYLLPSMGGHELTPVRDSANMVVSTMREVLLFDRDTRKFSPHPDLNKIANVKSVSTNAATGQIASTRGDIPNWWTSTIHLLHPENKIVLEGEKIYKVRWVQ